MKIALLLKGRSKGDNCNYVDSIQNYKTNLFQNHNVDVFLHTTKSNYLIDKYLVDDYKPKKYLIESQKYLPDNPRNNHKNMCHSIISVIELFKDYIKNNITYDFIVLTRFDLLFKNIIPFNKLKKDRIYSSFVFNKALHDDNLFIFTHKDLNLILDIAKKWLNKNLLGLHRTLRYINTHSKLDFLANGRQNVVNNSIYTINRYNNPLNHFIDGIIFINLEHRKDRYEHTMKQFHLLNFDINKIFHLKATYIKTNGAKGCSHSHMRAIKLAIQQNWNNVMIMEDDFVFKISPLQFYQHLYDITNKNNNWDLIMPYWLINKKNNRTTKIDDNCLKITCGLGAYTTLCYFVNNKFFNKLYNNFIESYTNQNIDSSKSDNKYAVDRNWFKLQKRNNWFLIDPPVLYQMESYSDVANRVISAINK